MEFGLIDGVFGAESEVEDVDDGLENRGGNSCSAGGAYYQVYFSFVQDQGGCHRAEHTFAGSDGIGLSAYGSIHIGYTGFDAEIVLFVIEKKAGAAFYDPAAITAVESSCYGYGIPLFIHDIEVGGL